MQHRVFMYRLPEHPNFRQISIPAGRQQKFPEDFEGAALESLVTQLKRAGAAPVSEINAINTAHSFIFSVSSKPITSAKIDAARERDEFVRQEISAQKTEEAGLATFAAASGPSPDKVRATSLEVLQLNDQGDDPKKGGVDFEANVSRRAGRKETTSRRGG